MPEEVLETIQRVQDLHKLSVNYTSDEIDQVPAPDGFNGQFLKNCWNIIKTDFYKLCKDFQEGSVTLQSINDLIKQKVFMWLFLVDRLNTRDMMERRHWTLDSGINWGMCPLAHRETWDRLFFNCDFVVKCWQKLGIQWNSTHGSDDMFEQAKRSFQGPIF
jgi:hypothetical protein